MKNFNKNTKLTIGGVAILALLIVGGIILWPTTPAPDPTPGNSDSEKEELRDNSFKYETSNDDVQVSELSPLSERCDNLEGQEEQECLIQKQKEEYILSGDHEKCLDLEDVEYRDECLFRVIENREGAVGNTQQDLEELQDLCKLITDNEREIACLEQLAMFSSYKFDKNICEETFSPDSEPFDLKKCKDRTYALEVEDRIKDAETDQEKKQLIERCNAEEDPLAEEYAILCRDYGLSAIDYNCEILDGDLKDWCETERIYQEKRIMTIEDCQEIPAERERRVCIREIETQTNRSDLDSDGDGASDARELFYNTDPFDPDTNNDGLTDGEQLGGKFFEGKKIGTDPLQEDTDGDGFTDYEEVKEYDTDPLDPQSYPQ